jgi:hypothetical protein
MKRIYNNFSNWLEGFGNILQFNQGNWNFNHGQINKFSNQKKKKKKKIVI